MKAVILLLLLAISFGLRKDNSIPKAGNTLSDFIMSSTYSHADTSNADFKSFFSDDNAQCNPHSDFVKLAAFVSESDNSMINFMIDACVKTNPIGNNGSGALVCVNKPQSGAQSDNNIGNYGVYFEGVVDQLTGSLTPVKNIKS